MSHFPEFWKRYPNKTGKRQAEKIWKDRKLDEQWESIAKFLEWAPIHDEKWKKGFVPMGSTFVNQERWNDHDRHLKPQYPNSGRPVSSAPDPNRVVEWITKHKNLTEKQITSPWQWVTDGTRLIGVHIPDMPPMMFKSMREAVDKRGTSDAEEATA